LVGLGSASLLPSAPTSTRPSSAILVSNHHQQQQGRRDRHIVARKSSMCNLPSLRVLVRGGGERPEEGPDRRHRTVVEATDRGARHRVVVAVVVVSGRELETEAAAAVAATTTTFPQQQQLAFAVQGRCVMRPSELGT
jgi:hypothetical protein